MTSRLLDMLLVVKVFFLAHSLLGLICLFQVALMTAVEGVKYYAEHSGKAVFEPVLDRSVLFILFLLNLFLNFLWLLSYIMTVLTLLTFLTYYLGIKSFLILLCILS